MVTRPLKVTALAVWIVALVAQPSWAQPPMPLHVYGTVKVDGADVIAGTQITAWCTGVLAGSDYTFFDQGHSVYFVDVLGDNPDTPTKDGCVNDDTVSLKIGDRAADQTTSWTSGEYRELPLTAGVGVRVFLPLVLR